MAEEKKKRPRAALWYGYSVCLVSIVVFLISLASLVGALFDLSDPLHARTGSFGQREPSLASFENYKMDILKSPQPGGEQASKATYVPDDQTLRAMYEAAKSDKIQSVRLQAHRSVTVDGLLIAVCIALFAGHWIWLRRLSREWEAAV